MGPGGTKGAESTGVLVVPGKARVSRVLEVSGVSGVFGALRVLSTWTGYHFYRIPLNC